MPFLIKLIGIIIAHLFLNLIFGFSYWVNEISFTARLIHGIIHAFFIAVVIRLLYRNESILGWKKTFIWVFAAMFLVANLIPRYLPMEWHDNGFVPIWSQASQTVIGWPEIILRFFDGTIQNMHGDVPNPIFHFGIIFFNIYVASLSR